MELVLARLTHGFGNAVGRIAIVLFIGVVSHSAQATSYNIVGALPYPGDENSYIGANYKARGADEETRFGARVANIVNGTAGATGTLINGVLNVTLTTEAGDTITLSTGTDAFQFEGATPSAGNNPFQQTNTVNANLTLPAGGLDGLWGPSHTYPGGDYGITFKPRSYPGYSNQGNAGPNSLVPNPDGSNTFLLTLWGGGPSLSAAGYRASTDIRLVVSAVPLPGALLLFGTALFGVFSFRSRRVAA